MAITGIDTIDGKQIIAAGAVSAKSAEMAYNDENGNPITGYLTAVPTGTMNESAFGYDSNNKISSYNGSALAGGSYQPSGNYIPYTAIDGNAFKTNSGLKIATFIGSELRTNFINNNFITLQSVNSTLGINNQVILATGSLTLKTKSDSAYVDREKIHKWDSASDYIQNNSATINEVNTSYQTNSGTYLTAHQDLSDYMTTAGMTAYLTAVPDTYLQNTDLSTEDGKVTAISGIPLSAGGEVPEGVMVESGLEYNAVNEISGYNGSAIAQYGAEKQWLVHDDTLVHAANSAQYALGVNLSAVAQLLGVDETVLWEGELTLNNQATLSEKPTNFDRLKFYWRDWATNYCVHVSECSPNYITSANYALNGTWFGAGSATITLFDLKLVDDFNKTITFKYGTFKNLTGVTTAINQANESKITKIVGIGRRS